MKILVTGSNGFLGSALVRRLLIHGERDIRCLVRPGNDTSHLESMKNEYEDALLEICMGSLTSQGDAAACLRDVDIVYHLAATMKGSPAEIFLNTVVSSKNLLENVSERMQKLVLISSFAVYGVADLPAGSIIDENTPLEAHPEWRDVYSHAKWRQEKLFRDYQAKRNFPMTVIRPGVVYGPGGGSMSARVGLSLFGLFLHMGDGNLIPLTYVDNCAEAIVIAGMSQQASGETYNVHDDDLPTARYYLKQYRKNVQKIKYLPVHYSITHFMSKIVKKYHRSSKGQMPAIFTPYKTANLWKGHRFTNAKIKSIGWKQIVSTEEGMERAFAYLKSIL
ncbi:MAG: NAD(P)-dependent oxidoreductase [Candidatus Latescibacterota bacterium]